MVYVVFPRVSIFVVNVSTRLTVWCHGVAPFPLVYQAKVNSAMYVLSPKANYRVGHDEQPRATFSNCSVGSASTNVTSVSKATKAFSRLSLFCVSGTHGRVRERGQSVPTKTKLSTKQVEHLVVRPPPVRRRRSVSVPVGHCLLTVQPTVVLSPIVSRVVSMGPQCASSYVNGVLGVLLFCLFPYGGLRVSTHPYMKLLYGGVSGYVPHLIRIHLGGRFVRIMCDLHVSDTRHGYRCHHYDAGSFIRSSHLLFGRRDVCCGGGVVGFGFCVVWRVCLLVCSRSRKAFGGWGSARLLSSALVPLVLGGKGRCALIRRPTGARCPGSRRGGSNGAHY